MGVATCSLILDIGGVLAHVPDVIDRWSTRLNAMPSVLLAAIYGGNDDAVLVGRVSDDEWWEIVRERLDVDAAVLAELRTDLGLGQVWDNALVQLVRDAKSVARTAILSNAWPSQRDRMASLGLVDLVDDLMLSCEIGVAKPHADAFRVALARLGSAPEASLFVDDSAENVDAAVALGLVGHVHLTTEDTARIIKEFLARHA